MTRICDHWATHRRVESPSGRRDARGFLYLPTSAKEVTRRDGPLGSFTRKEGFRYSKVIPTSSGRWKTPNCSRWSNFSWSSSSLPRADWGGSLSALEHSLFDWTHIDFCLVGAFGSIVTLVLRVKYRVVLSEQGVELSATS